MKFVNKQLTMEIKINKNCTNIVDAVTTLHQLYEQIAAITLDQLTGTIHINVEICQDER